MFLDEIHIQLASGEFSLLADAVAGSLSTPSIAKVNPLIQAGVTDLNKHFAIRENELLLRTDEREVYELIPANAVSSGNPDAFIIDTVADPFQADISQVIRVVDSNGQSLWLNTDVPVRKISDNIFGRRPDYFTHQGINFLAYNTLKLHKNHDLGDVIVQYKAKLKPIDFSGDPANTFIDVPDHFMNALVLYVASRKYNPMGSETIGRGMFHEGNNYWSKYQAELNELKANYASIASQGASTGFERGGWA